ncbi:hypothetical protein AOLI_G00098530 [Acnodon oligacanthus]
MSHIDEEKDEPGERKEETDAMEVKDGTVLMDTDDSVRRSERNWKEKASILTLGVQSRVIERRRLVTLANHLLLSVSRRKPRRTACSALKHRATVFREKFENQDVIPIVLDGEPGSLKKRRGQGDTHVPLAPHTHSYDTPMSV